MVKNFDRYKEWRALYNIIDGFGQKMVMQTCASENYSGIYHIVALTNVFYCKVMSVYPDVIERYSKYTNRLILPFDGFAPDYQSIGIMWTRVNNFYIFIPEHP